MSLNQIEARQMTRQEASSYAKSRLAEFNLAEWKVKLVYYAEGKSVFLGKCDYKSKTIFLNAHHIDIHPEIEVKDTINHEVAHALTPGFGHTEVWRNKAIELGSNGMACATYNLSPAAIDAIRSGDILEVDFVERKQIVMVPEERLVREPTHKITKFVDTCEVCGKVAKEKSSKEFRAKPVPPAKQGILHRQIILECGHIRFIACDSQSPFDLMVSNFWQPHVMSCSHKWNKNKCALCDEYRLFPFQVAGARAIERANGKFAIFDQQGLGKTVQALAYVKHNPVYPLMVICKSKLKYQWANEFVRWCGEDYFPQIIERSEQGLAKPYNPETQRGIKVYIISFDLLRRLPKDRLKSLGIKCAIIDEVQAIKNPDSTRTQEVRALLRDVPRIIPLSGTPWKNRGSEFFVVLNMLDRVKFHTYQHFLNQWVDYYEHGNQTKMGGIRNIKAFREAIKHIAIRRERSEVMPELPTVNRMKLVCEIEDSARKTYEDEVSDFVKWYNNLVISGEEDSALADTNAIARLQRMRHILGLAKIPSTVEWVSEFLDETDRKLVIGVHHIDVGQTLVYQLREQIKKDEVCCEVFHLTADLTDEASFELRQKFINSPRAVMVASTLSAGEGTDGLQKCCSDMVIHERQWNPMNEEQLEDRLIRIGQDSQKVNCTYVHCENSVDTHLDLIVETKRRQFHAVMNKGEIPAWQQSTIISELIKSIVASR